jgi:hypothetical protein
MMKTKRVVPSSSRHLLITGADGRTREVHDNDLLVGEEQLRRALVEEQKRYDRLRKWVDELFFGRIDLWRTLAHAKLKALAREAAEVETKVKIAQHNQETAREAYETRRAVKSAEAKRYLAQNRKQAPAAPAGTASDRVAALRKRLADIATERAWLEDGFGPPED